MRIDSSGASHMFCLKGQVGKPKLKMVQGGIGTIGRRHNKDVREKLKKPCLFLLSFVKTTKVYNMTIFCL